MFRKYARILVVTILSLVVMLAPGAAWQAAAAETVWQSPFVAIVWPHNGSGASVPVAGSKAVNVSVWPGSAVSCVTAPARSISLWQAANNEPAAPVDRQGEFFVRTQGGVKFPSMEFNNVPADMVSRPGSRYYFMVGGWQGNVWVDATDARTYLPKPFQPSGFSDKAAPSQIDARIQIVYPHDGRGNLASVDKATLDNIAVDLFEHRTSKSVPLNYNGGKLVLYIAEANGPMGPGKEADGAGAGASLEPYKVGGVTYPRWVFNNITVHPGRQYHFMVRVQGVETYPTVWTHSQDARTYLPDPPAPPACPESITQAPPSSSPTPCPDSWFTSQAMPGSCPSGPAEQVKAAYEPFERGHMIWRDGQKYDVLRSDNQGWEGYPPDLIICRDTSASVHAPPGLFAPVSGFGYLWRGDTDFCVGGGYPENYDHERLRNVLGWATAPETGYTATVQSGTKKVNGSTIPGVLYEIYLYTYITLPGNRILELSRNTTPNHGTEWKILSP